jgi:hypothetical protein
MEEISRGLDAENLFRRIPHIVADLEKYASAVHGVQEHAARVARMRQVR